MHVYVNEVNGKCVLMRSVCRKKLRLGEKLHMINPKRAERHLERLSQQLLYILPTDNQFILPQLKRIYTVYM